VTAASFQKTVVALRQQDEMDTSQMRLERNANLVSISSFCGSRVIASAIGRMHQRCK
jgi:hypothetical protein